MERHEVEKVHQILLRKRKKYKITKLFVKQKALIVDFLPLQNISANFCSTKITVADKKKAITYLPKKIGESQTKITVDRPEIIAYQLQNVLATGDSSQFLTPDKETVYYEKLHDGDGLGIMYNHKNIYFHSLTLAKIKNYPEKKWKGEYLYFGGLFTFNYYHFLIEILAKVQFLSQIPNNQNLTIILDQSVQENNNLQALADFFFKDHRKVYLDNSFYHHFEKLWYITTPNPTVPNVTEGLKYEASFTKIDSDAIAYLRKVCLENFDANQVSVKPFNKIFIGRKSELRKYNEPELLHIAEKYGFQAVYFEDLNIHEQIFMLQNADFIVGASGAAWTNLLFAKAGSKGLTWLGTVWGDFAIFATLARLSDFDLNYIRNQNTTLTFHEDYTIDGNFFEEQLLQLLKL